jgi:hypothetical protein
MNTAQQIRSYLIRETCWWGYSSLCFSFTNKEIQTILNIKNDRFFDAYKTQYNLDVVVCLRNILIGYARHKKVLKKIAMLIVTWYRTKILQTRTIIARNKKDAKPDLFVDITYNPKSDPFWSTAFTTQMKGGFENGMYLVFVNRENTTQEAVSIYAAFKRSQNDAKKLIDNYVLSGTNFEARMRELAVLGDKWMTPAFSEYVLSISERYINDTLYNLDKTNSRVRLSLFIMKNRLLAEYIWSVNFSTETERRALGTLLKISSKNLSGFVKSSTIDELEKYLSFRSTGPKTIYDRLPPHLKQQITRAEANLASAKNGIRVGRFGHYISSDEINAAQTRLNDLWKDADRWISKNR